MLRGDFSEVRYGQAYGGVERLDRMHLWLFGRIQITLQQELELALGDVPKSHSSHYLHPSDPNGQRLEGSSVFHEFHWKGNAENKWKVLDIAAAETESPEKAGLGPGKWLGD